MAMAQVCCLKWGGVKGAIMGGTIGVRVEAQQRGQDKRDSVTHYRYRTVCLRITHVYLIILLNRYFWSTLTSWIMSSEIPKQTETVMAEGAAAASVSAMGEGQRRVRWENLQICWIMWAYVGHDMILNLSCPCYSVLLVIITSIEKTWERFGQNAKKKAFGTEVWYCWVYFITLCVVF